MRDLKLYFLRLILADFMTYVAKIYHIGLHCIYAALKTYNLDMILQLKHNADSNESGQNRLE